MIKSFADRVLDLAAAEPERTAVVCDGIVYTRREVARHIVRFAACLHELGVQPGARVGVVARNSELHLVCALAASHVGAVLVPLHFRSAPLEARHNLEDAGCSVVVFDQESAPAYIEATRAEGSHPGSSPSAFVAIVDDMDVLSTPPDGVVALSALCREATAIPPRADLVEDDIAMIHYTSGSTGRAKGVCLTYRNIAASWENWTREFPIGSDDVVLTVTPFAHVGGLQTFTLQVLIAGGVVIIQSHFSADLALCQIERYRVTLMFGVPRIYAMICRAPEFWERDLSALRCAVVGGAAAPQELVQQCLDRGISLSPSWGMTETTGGATLLAADHVAYHPQSVGSPLIHVQVRLEDDKGRPVAPGRQGRLLIRGDSVAAGYWVNGAISPLDSRACGWFDTGDIAVQDARGYLSISGRSSDRIISGGENIYPAEIECAMEGFPGAAEVAVVGVPDRMWGESPLLFVIPSDPNAPPTLEAVRTYLELRISRYKLPRFLRIVSHLPRTGQTGKIDRRALAAIARGNAATASSSTAPHND